MNILQSKIFRGDRVIWIVLLLLSLLSLLIVYSSTAALAYRQVAGNTLHFLIRQVFFLGAGIGVMLVMVNFIPVKLYAIFSNVLIYFSIGLLLVSVVLKFAGLTDGTGRTLNLGILSFQPAEIAKIALILYTAKVLGKYQKTREDLTKAFYLVGAHTVVVCGLIFLTNFSSSALLFATIFIMLFVGRVPFKFLFFVIVAGVGIVALSYVIADSFPNAPARIHTVKGRIDRYINGDPSAEIGITQADYAKLAIYEGGIFGKGPGYSDVSDYMAAAYNDFIFAIIVEEYGLLIGIMVIFLYLIFFFRSVMIVRKATRTFPAFLVTGLTMMLVFQAMINMGVSTGLLPVTGQPLPWVSLGGTSLIFTSAAFGCILSVSYQNQVNREMMKPPVEVNVPDEDYEINK